MNVFDISPDSTNPNCSSCSQYVQDLLSPSTADQMAEILLEFIPVQSIIEYNVLPFFTTVDLQVGTKLVVLDTYSRWYLSTVLEVKSVQMLIENKKACLVLRIRYDGWSSKWDEWMEWPNPCRMRLYNSSFKKITDRLPDSTRLDVTDDCTCSFSSFKCRTGDFNSDVVAKTVPMIEHSDSSLVQQWQISVKQTSL